MNPIKLFRGLYTIMGGHQASLLLLLLLLFVMAEAAVWQAWGWRIAMVHIALSITASLAVQYWTPKK